MKEICFINVKVVFDAPNARQAYNQLCEVLDQIENVEFETDTYTTSDDNHQSEHSTEELFPD